jgi:hypothetical protein
MVGYISNINILRDDVFGIFSGTLVGNVLLLLSNSLIADEKRRSGVHKNAVHDFPPYE